MQLLPFLPLIRSLNEKLILFNDRVDRFDGKKLEFLIPLSVFIFGFFYNLHFALIGFHPLDGSIVFDGGWRILNGQIPFKDFSAPAGTVPSLFQAGFFAIFGVGWLSYFAHSSLFNGLLGVLSYYWFRIEGGNIFLSCVLSFLSVFLFYPPTGFPYIETHSFFFSVLALFFTSLAVRRLRFGYVFGIFLSLLAGFLSKQIPIGILAFGVPILALRLPKDKWKKFLGYCLGSIAALGISIWLLNLILGIEWSEEFFYLFQITLGTGQDRFEGIRKIAQATGSEQIGAGSVWRVLRFLFDYILLFDVSKYSSKFFYFFVIAFGVCFIFLWRNRKESAESKNRSRILTHLLLSFLFLATGLFFAAVTKNQPQIGFIQFFFFLAFLCLALAKSSRHPLYLVLILFAFLITREFHLYVNRVRLVNDMLYQKPEGTIPLGYYELQWKLPELQGRKFELSDYHSFLEFSKKNPENLLYMGDMTVLLGLSGKQSVFPALWFHKDLTFPSARFKEQHEAFQNRLLENIEKYRVKYIVFEGNTETFSQISQLSDLELLSEFISKNKKEEFKIGNLPAIRIRD